MTQEEKELLLIDLCSRLPYRVKTIYKNIIMEVFVISTFLNEMCCLKWDSHKGYYNQTHAHIGQFKPYLRSMLSMTEEEKKEYDSKRKHICDDYNRYCFDTIESIDWLNAHHFDYRGLIPTGLALEAPKDMYKID